MCDIPYLHMDSFFGIAKTKQSTSAHCVSTTSPLCKPWQYVQELVVSQAGFSGSRYWGSMHLWEVGRSRAGGRTMKRWWRPVKAPAKLAENSRSSNVHQAVSSEAKAVGTFMSCLEPSSETGCPRRVWPWQRQLLAAEPGPDAVKYWRLLLIFLKWRSWLLDRVSAIQHLNTQHTDRVLQDWPSMLQKHGVPYLLLEAAE